MVTEAQDSVVMDELLEHMIAGKQLSPADAEALRRQCAEKGPARALSEEDVLRWLAKEYGLPVTLHAFIPEHHGTMLVRYFYHAASQARGPDDPEISDTEFRYPGPKPQTKETAIVMLCDGVEAAAPSHLSPSNW